MQRQKLWDVVLPRGVGEVIWMEEKKGGAIQFAIVVVGVVVVVAVVAVVVAVVAVAAAADCFAPLSPQASGVRP